MLVLCFSLLHFTYSLLFRKPGREMEGKCAVYRTQLPLGFYLGRGGRLNPRDFLQWAQETVQHLWSANFSNFAELRITPERTIFMRNLGLTFTPRYHEIDWKDNSAPRLLEVEVFNSHTGRTSFEITIRWYCDGYLIATLLRKMVYVSAKSGKPVELPEEFASRNRVHCPTTFSLEEAVPRDAAQTSLAVRPSDLDFNMHVGHVTYIDYILDSACTCKYRYVASDLMKEQRIKGIELEYRYPVGLGKKVVVKTWDCDAEEGVEVNFVLSQKEGISNRTVCLARVQLYDG